MADEEGEDPPSFHRLPDELLFDIFSRFPAKSLCLLRCVCSRWSSILTHNHDFISLYHRSQRVSPLLLLFLRGRSTAPVGDPGELAASCHCIEVGAARFEFAADFPGELISVLSCRGIVCLISESKALLYDPVTRRASNLTGSPNFKSSSSAALGYSAISGKFKLLHFYVVEKSDNYHYTKVKEVRCEILTVPSRLLGFDSSSLPSHEWRCLGRSNIDVLGRKSYACVDGSIYWLVAEKTYDPVNVRILSFDLESEEFGVVSFSRKYSDRSAECLGLLEVNERLCLTDKLPWETRMKVWELEGTNTNRWIQKFKIDLAGIGSHDLKILGHIRSSIGHEEGKLVIKVGGNRSMVYDLATATFREVEIQVESEGETKELGLLLDRKNLL